MLDCLVRQNTAEYSSRQCNDVSTEPQDLGLLDLTTIDKKQNGLKTGKTNPCPRTGNSLLCNHS